MADLELLLITEEAEATEESREELEVLEAMELVEEQRVVAVVVDESRDGGATGILPRDQALSVRS